MSNQPIFKLPENNHTAISFFILASVITLVAYGNLYTHNFWDGWDDLHILADLKIMAQNPAHMVSAEKNYQEIRPPVDVVFLAGYLLWKDSAAGFHVLQISLHLLATLLFVHTLKSLDVDLELRLCSALFFLINPVHFRSLHWITAINYNLALIFSLGVVIAFSRRIQNPKPSWPVAEILALSLAIFSHPSAASVVLFCLYWAWRKEQTLKQTVRLSLPILIAAPILAGSAYLVSPGAAEVEGAVAVLDVFRPIQNLFWYFGRLVTSSLWLSRPVTSSQPFLWEMGVGVLVLAGICLLYQRRHFPAADWGVWALVSILPFLNNSPNRLAFGPSRQLYFASIGSSLVFVWAFRHLIQNTDRLPQKAKQLAFLSLLLLITTCSVISLKRAEALSLYFAARGYDFQRVTDTASHLYERAFQRAPDLVPEDMYFRLANLGFARGQSYEQTLKYALQTTSNPPQIHMLLGVTTMMAATPEAIQQGEQQIQKSLSTARNSDRLKQDTATSLLNLGTYYHLSGQFQHAIEFYRKSLKHKPKYPEALFSLGDALYKQGYVNEAVRVLQYTVEQAPDHVRARQNLGGIFLKLGRLEEAQYVLESALRIDPRAVDVYINLGIAHFRQGQEGEAIVAFRKVVDLAPDHWEAHLSLGQIYEKLGHKQTAAEAYRKALSLNPSSTFARNKLQSLNPQP